MFNKHNISIVIDRLILKDDINKRLTESVETCLKHSNGIIVVEIGGHKHIYSTNFSCPECGFSYEEISPRFFSFNSPFGACSECDGLGFTSEIDEKLILKHPEKSIAQGALRISGWNMEVGSISEMYYRALSEKYGFSLHTPVQDLPKDILNILLYGNNGEQLNLKYSNAKFSGEYSASFEGIIPIHLKFLYIFF